MPAPAISDRAAAALAGFPAALIVVAYATVRAGLALQPGLTVLGAGLLAGLIVRGGFGSADGSRGGTDSPARVAVWAATVVAALAALVAAAWPTLLPPGGASDLTHHLVLIDVLDRTRRLVSDAGAEAVLGEMAHYTPGFHLLTVTAASLTGLAPVRVVYPVLALTVALKAGVVCLIAYDGLPSRAGRAPLALAAVALALFAPRAYVVDGFLQAGFYAQVASELFVVAGWWALARWWLAPDTRWAALAGLLGAATFLVWPIWIGPLVVATALAVFARRNLSWTTRGGHTALVVLPVAAVATAHLLQHAAWLRLAGTSGAVPAFDAAAPAWLLGALALVGLAATPGRKDAKVTVFFGAGIAAQALVLWALARARGAETPYMAMKMIYLAVYPTAVLASTGLASLVWRVHGSVPLASATALAVGAAGVRLVAAGSIPPPTVSVDLDNAGRWARAHLPASCVDYIVDNAEQAYWLHLAVMGEPRASARTADIDGYTTNRAVGRWLERSSPPYAVARRALLPGEILAEADELHAAGEAVVIARRGSRCP